MGAQAELAAAELAELTGNDDASPFDVVYCSPAQRCVATAEPFSRVFNAPIQIVAGVGECMGALRGHMRSHVTWHKDPLFKALLTLEELQALCPTATFIEPDAMVSLSLDEEAKLALVGLQP